MKDNYIDTILTWCCRTGDRNPALKISKVLFLGDSVELGQSNKKQKYKYQFYGVTPYISYTVSSRTHAVM